MKLNQKLAKKVLAVALTLAMVVTSLFVMPTTANAATGATIGRYASVKAGTTNVTTVKNLGKNYYAKVSVTGTAKSGVTITRVNGNKVTATTKIQGTGNNIKLNVKNWNVPGKSYKLVVKTYSKKTNKLVRTYTAKSTFVYKTLTNVTLDETAEVVVGKTVELKAVKTPATATTKLTWSSSDETVATVKDGVVSGVKAGEATITVKSSNGKTATCKVTVKNTEPTSVTLNATHVKELTAVFDAPVDTTVASVTVSKGTAAPTVTGITWSDDKKTATIAMGGKLSAGTYTVKVTGYSNELTASVTTKDETLTSYSVSKYLIANATVATTASVSYTALNQYGDMMAANAPTSSCTFGAATATAPTATAAGVVTVTGISTILAIAGTTGSLVLVDSSTGINATETVTYSTAATASELTVAGMYNTSTGKLADMTAGDTVSSYEILFTAKDQYGNALEADDVDTELTYNVVGGLTNISKNAIGTRTVSGTEYISIKLTGASGSAAVAGTMYLTIVNPSKGLLYSGNFTVAYGTTVASISISAPNSVYNGEKNTLAYEVTDADGKAITSYKKLTALINLTGFNGMTWAKNTDGTASLIYTPSLTFTDGTNDKESTIAAGTITGNYAVAEKTLVKTLSLTVYENRYIKSVSNLSMTTSCANTKSLALYTSSVVYEDQYSNEITSSDTSYIVSTKDTLFSQGRAKLEVGIADTTHYTLGELQRDSSGYYYGIAPVSSYIGSTTLYVLFDKNSDRTVGATDYDYKTTLYTTDTTSSNTSGLAISYIASGYEIYAAIGEAVTTDNIWGVKVTGIVGGNKTTIPASQYTIASVKAPAITASEVAAGTTSKTGTVTIVVSTYDDDGKEVTTELTSEFTYSVANPKVVEIAKVGQSEFNRADGEALKLDRKDLLAGFVFGDQYCNSYSYDINQGFYIDSQSFGDTGYGVYDAADGTATKSYFCGGTTVGVANAAAFVTAVSGMFANVTFESSVTAAKNTASNVNLYTTQFTGTKSLLITFTNEDIYTVVTTATVNDEAATSTQNYIVGTAIKAAAASINALTDTALTAGGLTSAAEVASADAFNAAIKTKIDTAIDSSSNGYTVVVTATSTVSAVSNGTTTYTVTITKGGYTRTVTGLVSTNGTIA